MLKAARFIRERVEDMAVAMTPGLGQPIAQSRGGTEGSERYAVPEETGRF
jgi:hypothetical protein